jgi:hypothetical protein
MQTKMGYILRSGRVEVLTSLLVSSRLACSSSHSVKAKRNNARVFVRLFARSGGEAGVRI